MFANNTNMDIFIIKKYIKDFILITIGCAFMAAGVVLFLLPNQLSSGGFSGIATVLYYLFNFKIGTTILVLNIPLFVISFFKLGKEFFTKAIFGTVMLSILLDVFEGAFQDRIVITQDKFLASIYGGLIIGIGNSIIIKYNASTGGTELLSNIISRISPKFRIGHLMSLFDIAIVVVNMVALKQIEIGLYSAISIYIINKIIEVLAEGINFTKMLFIVSDKYEEISKEISDKLGRGSTAINATGMYEKADRKILWCVVSKNEVAKIREIANNIDRNSFMSIFNAREVYGMGFKKI